MSIISGVRLNFGKRGVSMSVGPRGAKMTIGPSGARATVGIPGTGLSYTEKLDRHELGHVGELERVEPQPRGTFGASRSSGFAMLGWIVAGVLFVLLIAALS
jgi:hypothetical protein